MADGGESNQFGREAADTRPRHRRKPDAPERCRAELSQE